MLFSEMRCGQGVRRLAQVQQAARLGLVVPLLRVVVAVEDDLLVRAVGVLDHGQHRLGELGAVLQLGLERLGHPVDGLRGDRVEHRVGEARRHRRAQRPELELVAREGERRGAVAVAAVLGQRRQHRRAQAQVARGRGRVAGARLDRVVDPLQLGPEEDREDGRRRLVGAQAVVLAGGGDGGAQQGLVLVHRRHDRGAEEQEEQVLVRRVARLEQVRARVRAHRPVVVLARAVHARERLLVQQADEAVLAGDALQELHAELLVVAADVGVLEDRGDLVLGRRDLVVARLDRHAQLGQLLLGLQHVGQHALGDRAEVVVVELVALRRLGAEQRAAGRVEVRALEVEALVDQEVLLLGPHRREHARDALLAQEPERARGRARERVHGAQERDLVVQRLAGPGGERRGDAEQRPVRVLEDEGGGRRVPRGVAARLERRADAARGERGGVRLALDELLAGELGDGHAVAGRAVEGVVLLGGDAGERLEPVREVRGALLHRPVLHGGGHGVGEGGVERLAAVERLLQRAEHRLGQALALDGGREDVRAVRVGARLGQVGLADRAAVGAPLGGRDVLGSRTRHRVEHPPRVRVERV